MSHEPRGVQDHRNGARRAENRADFKSSRCRIVQRGKDFTQIFIFRPIYGAPYVFDRRLMRGYFSERIDKGNYLCGYPDTGLFDILGRDDIGADTQNRYFSLSCGRADFYAFADKQFYLGDEQMVVRIGLFERDFDEFAKMRLLSGAHRDYDGVAICLSDFANGAGRKIVFFFGQLKMGRGSAPPLELSATWLRTLATSPSSPTSIKIQPAISKLQYSRRYRHVPYAAQRGLRRRVAASVCASLARAHQPLN